MPGLCRDCISPLDDSPSHRCIHCGSPRTIFHAELNNLTIAHMDCDAFYASVEKRDNPDLEDRPVIIGGGKRGVVSTACYIARINGVKSAMPMFKALKACPNAEVVRPRMEIYSKVGKEVRDLMRSVTPLVEPISIDEAFMDLTGTERLHKQPAAATMARLANRIEEEIGITISIGLSYNKFLAKLASDMDKPRGFSVIGREEALTLLASLPVGRMWGVGKAMEKKLLRDGVTHVAQLQKMDEPTLMAKYGAIGQRLARLSQGKDARIVKSDLRAKSISSEITFFDDIDDPTYLETSLWSQAERVSYRCKQAGKAGRTVTLKLKTKDFKTTTRSRTLPGSTQLAEVIFKHVRPLLVEQTDGRAFRLLGVGLSSIVDATDADQDDLLDPDATKHAHAERALDTIRSKFGKDMIKKGRGMHKKD